MGLLVLQDGVETVRKDDEYNVPRFLNRVLALDVDRQNALFDQYAKLFDEIVSFAKANGTFDEGVTDINALSVRLSNSRVGHRENSTGAETTHYTLEIDQPSKKVSFADANDARRNKDGAFFEHLRKGTFMLALESGRHTDPETGHTYRNFSVSRPEGARTNYIREAQLTENYRPVVPETVRDWWTEKHAAIPDIQTSEIHVISGAITPLWQRLKTTEATHLRVVRVTADDGQRIVGVQIPSERVGAVLRALGVASTSREPEEIFDGVLSEGEEIELTSALKLKLGNIHGEPAIELCGTDPSMFGVLRKLGLINEQINWKQRFFVPTDEESGIALLAAILEQFQVIPNEAEETERDLPLDSAMPSASSMQPIDLERWILEPREARRSNSVAEHEPRGMTESETESTSDKSELPSKHPNESTCLPIECHARAATLQTQPQDFRAAAIQIGFNFAEGELV
jgi:hypothetical protein